MVISLLLCNAIESIRGRATRCTCERKEGSARPKDPAFCLVGCIFLVADRSSSSSTPFVPKKAFSFTLSKDAPLPELSKRFLNPAAQPSLPQIDSRMSVKPVTSCEKVIGKSLPTTPPRVAKTSLPTTPPRATKKSLPTTPTRVAKTSLPTTPPRTDKKSLPTTPTRVAKTPLPYAMPSLSLPTPSNPPTTDPEEMPRIRSLHILQPAELVSSTAVDRAALLFALIMHSHFMRTTFTELQFLFRILSCGVAFDYDSPRHQADLPVWRALSRPNAVFSLPQHCFSFCLFVLDSMRELLLSLPVLLSSPTHS